MNICLHQNREELVELPEKAQELAFELTDDCESIWITVCGECEVGYKKCNNVMVQSRILLTSILTATQQYCNYSA